MLTSHMSVERLVMTVASVVLVMLSASFHEFGHAWAAHKLGDDTAKQAGRLTLNPLAHIDRFGSVILPLLMSLAGGPVFAFAKPVPYNPNNLRNPKRDDVLVAFAGPATNILQACLGAVVGRILWEVAYVEIVRGGVAYWAYSLVYLYVYINCTLAFFNLIPLPPLDGSSIITPLLSGNALRTYYRIQNYSMPILLVLMYMLPSVVGVDPIGLYLDATAGNLASLLLGWA